MSAALMPRCGRPGAVSSILTEMVGVVGTPPIPVYGFLAGGGGGVLVGVAEVDVVVGAADVFFGLLSPPHAALARSAVTASEAARAWRARVMFDPFPSAPGWARC